MAVKKRQFLVGITVVNKSQFWVVTRVPKKL